MKSAASSRLSVGPYVLDLARRGLYKDGVNVHLAHKPFETLAYLVEHRDRTVTKQELMDRVWAQTSVTDGVLTQAVREVRRVLNDPADDPAFVLTVPREGYRFVGAVVAEAPADAPCLSIGPGRPTSHHGQRQGGLGQRRWLAPVIALIAVTVVMAIARRGGNPPSRGPLAAVRQLVPVTPSDVSAVKPVFSPDGSQLVYVSDGDEPGVLDLFVIGAAGGTPRRLTRGVNASGDLPTFTADGSAVVFSRFRAGAEGGRVPDLWRVRITGGEPALFLRAASGAGFSADGLHVAYTRHTSEGPALYAGPVERPEHHRKLAMPGFTPRWSPDGRWIAYVTSDPEGGRGLVWIVSPDGTGPRALTQETCQFYGLTWAGPGRLVYASNATGAFHLWEVRPGEGPARPLTSGLGDYLSPSVGPDASRVAFGHLRLSSELWLTSLGSPGPSRVLPRTDYYEMPRLAPDGRRAAAIVSRADAEPRAYVIDLATGRATRLVDRPASGLCWVDDRRVAVLAAAAAGLTDLLVVGIDGSEPVVVTRIRGEASWAAVRRDLRRVAFVVERGGLSRVTVRDLETGRDTVVGEGRGLHAVRWSPDGGAVTWSAAPQGAPDTTNGLWIAVPGTPARRVAEDGYGPVWSADGASLYFSRYADSNGGAGVWHLDLATGTTRQVTHAQRVADFDIVGDQLIYVVASGRSRVFTALLP